LSSEFLLAAAIAAVLILPGEAVADDPPDGPFGRGTRLVQASAHGLREAWNFNEMREDLYGGTLALGYGFGRRWAIVLEISTLRVTQVLIRDAWLSGVSPLLRWRVAGSDRWTFFIEAGPGVSYADTPVPFRGTRFNYLFQTGPGVTRLVSGRAHLAGGLRWLHLSNNSLAGRDRNPDIQALGGHLGVLVTF
jgi:hypothetical protein